MAVALRSFPTSEFGKFEIPKTGGAAPSRYTCTPAQRRKRASASRLVLEVPNPIPLPGNKFTMNSGTARECGAAAVRFKREMRLNRHENAGNAIRVDRIARVCVIVFNGCRIDHRRLMRAPAVNARSSPPAFPE